MDNPAFLPRSPSIHRVGQLQLGLNLNTAIGNAMDRGHLARKQRRYASMFV
jgi:hypothetical protein